MIWDKGGSNKQTDGENLIVSEAEDKLNEALQHRRWYERQWYINMSFYLGFQWIRWNSDSWRIEIPPAPSWRIRLTCNHLQPIIAKYVGRIKKNRPVLNVVPATEEESDKNTAVYSQEVLEHIERVVKLANKNTRLATLVSVYGTGFKDHYWDGSAGDRIEEPRVTKSEQTITDDDGYPIVDEYGQPQTETVETPELDKKGEPIVDSFNLGEVAVEVLGPFEVVPQPGARHIDDCEWVFKCKLRSLEWIRSTYKEGYKVNPETSKGSTPMEKQLLQLIGESKVYGDAKPRKSHIVNKDDELKEGFATVKEWRVKPNKTHARGRLVVFANGILLHDGDLPYEAWIKTKSLGIKQYDFTEVHDRFWGRTPLEDLIPLQVEYNKTRSQIIEIKNRMSKPHWIVAEGQNVPKEGIPTEPGAIIRYTPVAGAQEPHQTKMSPLPAYVHKDLESNLNDMQNISSQHEVSRGTVPPGVGSGVAIQLLLEQDETPIGPTIERYEQVEGESGMLILNLVKEKYKEPRKIVLIGKDNELLVKDFTASENMPTDVIVQSGTAMPQSKAARQAMVMDLWREGMLKDESKALRLLELGNVEELFEEVNADEKMAEIENRRVKEGQPIQVYEFENHIIHVDFHDKLRKSLWYENADEQLRMMIDQHQQEHESYMQPPPGQEGPPPGGQPPMEGEMPPAELPQEGMMPPMGAG